MNSFLEWLKSLSDPYAHIDSSKSHVIVDIGFAKLEDIDGILRLLNEQERIETGCIRKNAHLSLLKEIKWSINNQERSLYLGNAPIAVVARVQGVVVGCCIFLKNGYYGHKPNLISQIVVIGKMRRRKIATSMLEYIINLFPIGPFEVFISVEDIASVELFLKLGFQNQETVQANFRNKKFSAYHLVKN